MLDFRRPTAFCLGYRLSNHKMTRYAENVWGAWPPGPPYSYAFITDCQTVA